MPSFFLITTMSFTGMPPETNGGTFQYFQAGQKYTFLKIFPLKQKLSALQEEQDQQVKTVK